MAAPRQGGDQRGSYFPPQRTLVSQVSDPTRGSDTGNNDPLLDISEIEILNKTLLSGGMDIQDGLSSIGNNVLFSTGVRAHVSLPHHHQPPQPQHIPDFHIEGNDANSASVLSPRQKRLNPFDVAKRDFWQSLEYSVGELTREVSTGNITASNQNSLDPYDPLNFGDPTFVNSYSSSSVLTTFASQNTAHNTGLKYQLSSLKQPVTELPGSFSSRGLSLPIEPSLPHRNIPCSVAQVNLSHHNQSSVNTGPPVLGGFERKSEYDIQFSSTSHQSLAVANAQRQSNTSSVVSGSAVLTDRRPTDTINKYNQDYIGYPGTDLIIRDYTLSSASTRVPQSYITSSSSSNTSKSVGLKPQGSGYSNAFIPNKHQLLEKHNGTNQGCIDNLRINSGHLLTVVGGMGDEKHVMVDDFGGNRSRVHSTSVGDRGGGQRESFYSLDTRGNIRHEKEENDQSLWEEESESGFLESAPLLDSEVTNKRATLSIGSQNNRIGNPFEISRGVAAVYNKTGAKAETASSQHSLASHQLPCWDLTARECKDNESLKRSMREGNQTSTPEGNNNSTQGVEKHASTVHCVDTQRNAYGELSPLPQFLGQDLAGRAGEARRGPYRHCHKRRMMSLTDKLARRQLVSVVILCLLFMIGEGIGGFLANSLALFTDVLHLGSDLISFIISLLAMWLANKPATRRMSFGYHRAEVLGALFSVFIIWLVSGVLCYIAVDRILHQHYMDVKPDEMLITASLGVLFNIVMGLVLHSEMCCGHAHSHNKFGHGHSHAAAGHGHSHGKGHGHSKDDILDVAPTQREGSAGGRLGFDYQRLEHQTDGLNHQMQNVASMTMASAAEECSDEFHGCVEEEEPIHKHKNINVRAAFIHVVGDIIQSLGVLVAALIIKFTADEKYRLADPICTFLFSILVLITTVTVLRDSLLVVMEGVPRDLSIESLRKDLSVLDGVVTVHSLHIWALTLDRNALSVHLAVENSHIHDQVLSAATKLIQDQHHFFHSTIQVELYDEVVMTNCKECTEWK